MNVRLEFDEGSPAALPFQALPEGWKPQGAVLLVKCLDEDGDPTWAFRTSEGLSDEELLGALLVRSDLLRRQLSEMYVSTDDDE